MSVDQPGARDEVLKAEQDRCDGLLGGDRAKLDGVYSSDFVYVHSSGRIEARDSYLTSVTSGPNKFLAIDHADLKVEVMGEAALMTGAVTMDRTKGRVVFLFAEVWVRDGGGWKLKYQQNTKAAGA